MFMKILSIFLAVVLTTAGAVPAPDKAPTTAEQQPSTSHLLAPPPPPQTGGTILIPVSRFAQTQIRGVPYIILPATGPQHQQFQQQSQFASPAAPGRFFFRTGGFPVNTIGPIPSQQPIFPVPIQQQQQQPFFQNSFEESQPDSAAAFGLRIAQQPFAPVPIPIVSGPPAAPAFVQPQQPQPVLVRQEVLDSGKKVAVFRKPLEAAPAGATVVRVTKTSSEAGESVGANNKKHHVVVSPPQPYSFSYSINGAETGDVKSASETSDGKVITGSYSVVEPDGTLRVVKYQADPVHGFSAQVERTAGAYPAIPDPPRRPEEKPVTQE